MRVRKDGQGKLGDKGGVVVGGRCHYVTFNAYSFFGRDSLVLAAS